MSDYTFAVSRRTLTLLTLLVGCAAPAIAAAAARVSEDYGRLPIHFEVNRGQAHEDVRFLARGTGYGLYLTASEAVIVLARPRLAHPAHPSPTQRKREDSSDRPGQPKRDTPAGVESLAVRMSLVDAAPASLVSGVDELPGKANYFIGNDPSQWRTNVPTYAKVRYSEVYPGIDLIYYGNQGQLEYDFIVAPGADPKSIELDFMGVDKLEIDAAGDLVLRVAHAVIHQRRPVIYQQIEGARQPIDGRYVLLGENRVGLQLAAYDRGRPLVIDPVVLYYSTYLGGSGNEVGQAVAADDNGNAYVTGWTASADFPTTPGALQPIFGGSDSFVGDVFVTKLNPTGSELVYSTYLGGSSPERGIGIAVDADGHAYVTGYTQSGNFPTTGGALQLSHGGGSLDAFVAKLDPTGSALVYSTYLGGDGFDLGSAVAVDAAARAYVTGYAYSTNLPITAGAFQPALGGVRDAFVAKLDETGSTLAYSTFLGGSDWESGRGIAVDSSGHAFVTGWTVSTDFPTTAGALQPSYGGGSFDALGGSRNFDSGHAIAVDAEGNAYITGDAQSLDFPTTDGAYQRTHAGGSDASGGGSDAFVAKFVEAEIRFEEDAAVYTGAWNRHGSEIGSFSGGTVLASNATRASATFRFIGVAVTWIGVKCNVCGIATVSIDGGPPTIVNTSGPSAPPNLSSEPVFSASGLDPALPHTLVITVTGATTTSAQGLLVGDAHVAVDACDVTR